jgi:hypothetical protein
MIPHSSDLPVFAPADFFSSRGQSPLVGLLSQNSFNTSQERVVRTIAKDKFADNFRSRWTTAESKSVSAVTKSKYDPKEMILKN